MTTKKKEKAKAKEQARPKLLPILDEPIVRAAIIALAEFVLKVLPLALADLEKHEKGAAEVLASVAPARSSPGVVMYTCDVCKKCVSDTNTHGWRDFRKQEDVHAPFGGKVYCRECYQAEQRHQEEQAALQKTAVVPKRSRTRMEVHGAKPSVIATATPAVPAGAPPELE